MPGRFLPLIRGVLSLTLRRPHMKTTLPQCLRADSRRRIFGRTPGLRRWRDHLIMNSLLSIEDLNHSPGSN